MQGILDAHDLQARCRVRLGVAGRGDLAIAEVTLGVAHAAHLQALAQQGFEALADDELGAAAADVGDQALARRVGQGVGDAQIDEAGLFAARDDLYRMAEDLLRADDEFVAVAGFAQGVGAHDAHRAQGQAVDQLGEALEAVQTALHRLFAELALFVDAGGQLDLFAQAFEDADFIDVGLGHHHMKAVRAQVDGGDQGQVLGFGLRHGQRISVVNPRIVPRSGDGANAPS